MHSCCAGRNSEVCLRLGRVGSRGWWTMYHPRFVLDGIRSLFRLVVFEMCFHVQIKQSCKSERLVAFFWCGQDQKGTGGTVFFFSRCGEIKARTRYLVGLYIVCD